MESIPRKKEKSPSLSFDGYNSIENITTIITEHVTLTPSKRFDIRDLIKACVSAAASSTTISGFQHSHSGLPSDKTCLKYLHLLNIDEIVYQNSAILLSVAKNIIKPRNPYSFAIDIVQMPYYGKREEEISEKYITGGQRKASTNYFFSYLTLYICDNFQRFTLLVLPWEKGNKMIDGVKRCIEFIRENHFNVKCLCMDRGFYSVDIFQYLQDCDIPHIVPLKEMGEDLKRLLSNDKSNVFSYTMKNKFKNSIDLSICDCVFYLNGKKGKHGKDHHAFVIYGLDPTPRKIRAAYSRRFGIESSYRLKNIPQAWTTSKDPVIRYFYTLLSFLIQNIWIYIQWKRFAKQQRGPKVIITKLFPLKSFISFLIDETKLLFRQHSLDDLAIS